MSDARKPTYEQLSALCAQMAAALEAYKADYENPEQACHNGHTMEKVRAALTAYRTISPDSQWQRVPEGHDQLIMRIARVDPHKIAPASLREDIMELHAILTFGCDCQNPHGDGIRHISEGCQVHNVSEHRARGEG